MTMDGKIATVDGKSKWITGEIARERVHQDRNRYAAIMVGIKTLLLDDPMLDCRVENGKNPIRIICDSRLRTPLDSRIVKSAKKILTILVTLITDRMLHEPYLHEGCEILITKEKEGHIDLEHLMTLLGEKKIDSILLEGGSTLAFSAFESRIVNKVQCYVAPKIFGGSQAKTPVGGSGFKEIPDSVLLENSIITQLGEDLLIESEVKVDVYRNH